MNLNLLKSVLQILFFYFWQVIFSYECVHGEMQA